jgi:hypothetical protein
VQPKRTTRARSQKGETMHQTMAGPKTLFPENHVSEQDVTEGLATDVERAKKNAEEIENSARVKPEDLRLQVSM